MNNKFFLGIGCQKGGTSWLYNYLASHPNVNLGATKEYHFFDTVLMPHGKAIVEDVRSQNKNFHLVHKLATNKDEVSRLLLRFYQKPETYFNYFRSMYSASPATLLVGDITPEYALLPLEQMQAVKKMCLKEGISPKIVFIMRDPVERIWSAVRMHRKIYSEKYSVNDTRTDDELVQSRFKRKDIEIRTRYEQTIQTIEAVFEPHQIHYEFFEQLYSKAAINKLNHFLNIPPHPPCFEQKINAVEKVSKISPKTRCLIQNYYFNTYQFLYKKFGKENIERLWQKI